MGKNMTSASISASASANNINNNAETLKGLIVNGYKTTRAAGADNFVFDYGEYKVFIEKGCLWTASVYKNWRGIADFDAELLDRRGFNYENSITYRWSNKVVDMAVSLIENTIDDYEREEQERINDTMLEVVAEAQETFDTLVMDLKTIAPTYDELKTKIDYYAAKRIVEKIAELGEELLSDLGNISGCSMCEEDGFWLETAEFERWGRGYTFDHIDETENLIDTLDYYLSDSDRPLGLDEEDIEFLNNGGCYCFDGYPWYIWQDLREFATTCYHYSYCA